MTEPAKPQEKIELPSEGGSYTRKPDGGLTPNPAPKKTRRKSPAKPAVKEA